MKKANRIIDTTLREGEQTPGLSFSLVDRKRIIDGLAAIGVDEVEVGIARLKSGFDPCQNAIGQCVEFFIIHRVLTSRFLLTYPSLMSRIAAACLTLCLAGCGLKGQLVLPPGPPPPPLLDRLITPPATPAQPPSVEPDVSTEQKPPSQ